MLFGFNFQDFKGFFWCPKLNVLSLEGHSLFLLKDPNEIKKYIHPKLIHSFTFKKEFKPEALYKAKSHLMFW